MAMRRPQWPASDHDKIAQELGDADRRSLEERISRVQDLEREFGPAAGMILIGGTQAAWALQEMQNCYVTANSMAVVLLAQLFIEHSLAGSSFLPTERTLPQAG